MFFLFLEFSAAAAKPEKYFNCRDETESNAKTKQSTCICNKCNQCHSNISFDLSYIWTLHHDMDKSQVVMTIFIHLLYKGFIWLVVFLKVVFWPLFARIYLIGRLNIFKYFLTLLFIILFMIKTIKITHQLEYNDPIHHQLDQLCNTN